MTRIAAREKPPTTARCQKARLHSIIDFTLKVLIFFKKCGEMCTEAYSNPGFFILNEAFLKTINLGKLTPVRNARSDPEQAITLAVTYLVHYTLLTSF